MMPTAVTRVTRPARHLPGHRRFLGRFGHTARGHARIWTTDGTWVHPGMIGPTPYNAAPPLLRVWTSSGTRSFWAAFATRHRFTPEATDPESLRPPSKYDLVGPANPNSNLRPIRFRVPDNETDLHRRWRQIRQETQEWNQQFWEKHNKQFAQEREAYIDKLLTEKYSDQPNKSTLTSDEMSVFYKDFLNRQWSSHVTYSLEWQKRNAKILVLSFLVHCQKWLSAK